MKRSLIGEKRLPKSRRKWIGMSFVLMFLPVVAALPSPSAAVLEGGLSFGGNAFVLVPNSSSLNPSQLTVESWVNLDALAGSELNQFILSKGNDRTQGSYYLSQNGDHFDFYLGANSVDQVHASSLQVQTNRWYHVTGTYDGTNVRIYVDGSLQGSTPASIVIGNTGQLTFGYHDLPGYPYWLHGSLRELRIWRVARTQAEIQATMNQALTGTEADLVGYWRLDEESGQVAHDSSGHGNDGQLGSTPSVDANDPAWLQTPSACAQCTCTGDRNGDGVVTIDEILTAVNNALNGCSFSCAPQPSGLVSWWPGEGNANDIVGGNNGTLLGAVFFTAAEVGEGFTFSSDGGDGVTIADNPNLNVQSSGFTADFWMKGIKNQPQVLNTCQTPSGACFSVLEKSVGEVDSTGWAFQGDSSSGLIEFYIGAGGGGPGNAIVVDVKSSVDALDGNFHHIAGTWDGANVALYVDGVLQGTSPLATPANNTRTVNVGYHWDAWGSGAPGRFFRGVVDEIQIFSRALSLAEIQAIFHAGSAGVCR
ncbi:MAG: LamG domain-containing protein [Candidatus Binatia bacterium]